MDTTKSMVGLNIKDEDVCLVDSATTHSIFKSKKYLSHLIMDKTSVNTISTSINLIEVSARANILFPRETKFIITDAFYSPKSHRNLLSFKDIRLNGYHIETSNMRNTEYLYITAVTLDNKHVLEKLPAFSLAFIIHIFEQLRQMLS